MREVTSFESMRGEFATLNKAFEQVTKNPRTGLTQGGSSDKNAGCRSAAKDANIQPKETPDE